MPACKFCGGMDLEKASQGVVCGTCGAVLDENVIVAEVEFQEVGTSMMAVGQTIREDGNFSGALYGSAFRNIFRKESREVSVNRAQKIVQRLATHLQIGDTIANAAVSYYKMALSQNVTQGRRLINIMSACLYFACRIFNTTFLLIDISDVAQIDPFDLSKAYLFLRKTFGQNVVPDVVDPVLYIDRFAAKLNLKDKEKPVKDTAVRLVSRMKRDWLATGRRPSGLCGAALLVAARFHGVNCTIRKIIRAVRVAPQTLMNRLKDFSRTKSSQLRTDEFSKVDLEEEDNPPSFLVARQQQLLNDYQEQVRSGWFEDSVLSELEQVKVKIEKMMGLRDVISTSLKLSHDGVPLTSIVPTGFGMDDPEDSIERKEETTSGKDQSAVHQESSSADCKGTMGISTEIVSDKVLFQSLPDAPPCTLHEQSNHTETGITPANPDEDPHNGEHPELWSDLDEQEIEGMILKGEEVQIREKLFDESYQEFLEAREKKRKKALEAKMLLETSGKPRRKRGISRKRPLGQTPEESLQNLLAAKRLKSKINIDILANLQGEKTDEVTELTPAETFPSATQNQNTQNSRFSGVAQAAAVDEPLPLYSNSEHEANYSADQDEEYFY